MANMSYISLGVLGILISLAICYLILSRFMDKKSLYTVFSTVFVLLLVLAAKIIFLNHSTKKGDIVEYGKLKYPFFELISEASPTDFERYVASVKNADQNTAALLTGAFINSEFVKYSQVASNKSLYNFFQKTLADYKIINEKNPILVLQLTFISKFKDKINFSEVELYVKDYAEDMLKLKGEVITSGIKDPHPITNEERDRAKNILQEIILSVQTTYGDEVVKQTLLHPEDPTLDPKTSAAIIIAIFEGILARNEDDAGIVIKQLIQSS